MARIRWRPPGMGGAPGRPFLAVLLALALGATSALDAGSAGSAASQALLRNGTAGLDASRATRLSDAPKVALYEGFLSHEECAYLIQNAAPKLDSPSGRALGDATVLHKYQDAAIRKIEDRINQWLIPRRDFLEAAKRLRYLRAQSYDVHYDFISNPSGDARKGARAATVLLFLSDVEEGGEIVFPDAVLDAQQEKQQRRSSDPCTAKGLVVTPKKGSALFFAVLDGAGQADPRAAFRECPVVRGKRWMAVKWLTVQRYSKKHGPDWCEDEHPQCEIWASWGECKKNPEYMVGSGQSLGSCRKACKACTSKK